MTPEPINYDKEIIKLDDIGRNIGYSRSLGSKIESGNLSKLSNRVNRIVETKKLKSPKINLQLLTENDFIKQISLEKFRNRIFTRCISYYHYYKFLKNNNYMPEYYKTAEPPSENAVIQHCISLLTTDARDKNIIIDPNIPLEPLETAKGKVINKDSITVLYESSVITINEEDISTLLTLRNDGLDDGRIIVTLDNDSKITLDIY